jgi:hypothetical protein
MAEYIFFFSEMKSYGKGFFGTKNHRTEYFIVFWTDRERQESHNIIEPKLLICRADDNIMMLISNWIYLYEHLII